RARPQLALPRRLWSLRRRPIDAHRHARARIPGVSRGGLRSLRAKPSSGSHCSGDRRLAHMPQDRGNRRAPRTNGLAKKSRDSGVVDCGVMSLHGKLRLDFGYRRARHAFHHFRPADFRLAARTSLHCESQLGIAAKHLLVRPETPLVLAAAGLIFTIRLRRRIDWPKLTLTISWMAVGLLLPLLPWASRNARVLGRIQFLAPHYAETEGDFIPYGFLNWSKTWMTRPDDNYLVPWKLGNAPIPIESLPASAF